MKHYTIQTYHAPTDTWVSHYGYNDLEQAKSCVNTFVRIGCIARMVDNYSL